jgi:1-deoxy-D-xylulose-5-phosphate reductoisomerase
LLETGPLTFNPVDGERFPALGLAYQALRTGGTMPAVLNAANETAVQLFRNRVIAFPDIARLTERSLHEHEFKESPTLDDLLEADRWARREVSRCTAC